MAEVKSKPKLTGAIELFSKSADIVQRNITTFGILYIIPLIVTVSGATKNEKAYNSGDFVNSGASVSGLPSYVVGSFIGFSILIGIALLIIGIIVKAMMYVLELEGAEGKKPSLQHLFDVAKKYWLRLFGLSIVLVIVIAFGFLLLIIPGLIMIRRYFFAPYVLVDKDVGIREAMKHSAEMSKPYTWQIWSIIGMMFLLNLPSIIPIFGVVLSFVLTMFYSVAPALRYTEIKKLHSVKA